MSCVVQGLLFDNVKRRPVPARRVVADAPVRLPSAPASAASGWHWPLALRPASFPLQGSAGLPKLGILLMFGITFIGRPIHLLYISLSGRVKSGIRISSSSSPVSLHRPPCARRHVGTRHGRWDFGRLSRAPVRASLRPRATRLSSARAVPQRLAVADRAH